MTNPAPDIPRTFDQVRSNIHPFPVEETIKSLSKRSAQIYLGLAIIIGLAVFLSLILARLILGNISVQGVTDVFLSSAFVSGLFAIALSISGFVNVKAQTKLFERYRQTTREVAFDRESFWIKNSTGIFLQMPLEDLFGVYFKDGMVVIAPNAASYYIVPLNQFPDPDAERKLKDFLAPQGKLKTLDFFGNLR